MDDPWGSPWASSDTTSKLQPPTPIPSPPKDLLSPPPRAFIGSTSNLQIQSPWANDDGFRDWTGAEQADITANALDWGVWAEPPSRISQPSPRPGSINRSSIALPSSAATSPGLRPLPRSRGSSVFRHHSPDPWATEFSLQDRKPDSPIVNLDALGIAALDDRAEILETPAPSAQRKDVVEALEASVEDTQSRKEGTKPLDDELQSREPSSLRSSPRESRDVDADSVPKVDIHDNPSRPSSVLSLGSSNEVERQDSPITSIDEDPKSRLQATSRKASGKVQELVGLYDHLAKAVTEEPSPPRLDAPSRGSRERSLSQARSIGAEDDTDFGDFEDVKSEYSKPASVINTSTPSKRSPTPKAPVDDTINQNQANESPGRENASLKEASASIQKIIEKFGPVRFDVDFQLIDKIFPDLPGDTDEKTSETIEIPERIIQDSFTAISERKTWYRISRYGSMLKHDSGDEDNYHRVQWSKSHIHSDTIKIVRRWMEEDSIAGRTTVGVGQRTSVFNWDSSAAAPVDLGKVFARKTSVAHSRNSSMTPQIQSPSQSVHSIGSSFDARKSIKSPILPPSGAPIQKAIANPNFRWSSESIRSAPITLPSRDEKIEHTAPKTQTVPAAIKIESRTSTTNQTPIQATQTEVILDDEDDDWGEMVSSPQVDVHPGPSLTKPLNNANGSTSTIPTVLANDISKVDPKNIAVAQSNNTAPKLSVSIPQSSQAPQKVPQQTGSSSAAPRVDPWPLADFSIFESLSAGTPKSLRQDPWPLADFSMFESPTSGSVSNWMSSLKSKSKPITKPRESQSIRASMDQVIETQTPLKAVLGPIQSSNSERGQDDIVRSIIQNLPDLSYMLH
ncbi:uncharacterized protein GGS22DRAFT_21688 [Annulohypoxylon maeteangense]|uniref:uncharacterized protein n=1 Tax=Annulohypoxylon maeteangense TaxID=1927788 RepID=UPI002008E18B|nr:uncharacterized protein GGS22DRAFT_21688 [Annulohypoxylon maeteangense]KAI0884301.1 hypothetical protein GGS22DRAFT_21688 [Annulohypoxylon maeteangense]